MPSFRTGLDASDFTGKDSVKLNLVNSCLVTEGVQSRHCACVSAQALATQVPGVLDVLKEAALNNTAHVPM